MIQTPTADSIRSFAAKTTATDSAAYRYRANRIAEIVRTGQTQARPTTDEYVNILKGE